jgi:small neutral amino acid transporter SnatA (MarC family)
VLLAVFIVVLNPGATARIISAGAPALSAARLATRILPGLAIAFAVFAVAAMLSDRILDWLDLSLSTFQIATGVLLVFGALQAFVGPAAWLREAERDQRLWLNAALLVWLLSPPPLALAIASGVSEGKLETVLAGGIALTAAAGVGLVWAAYQNDRWKLVLTWGTLLLAGFTVLAAIALIRRGVENV